MGGQYLIRHARAEHLERLTAIERAAATRFGDSLPREVLANVTPVEVLDTALRAGLLWVALEAGAIPVGFVVASICGLRMHIEELDVLPEHGRKGVGSALVAAAEGHAGTVGCTEITLTTFADVAWNAPLYARMGFQVMDVNDLDADLIGRLTHEAESGLDASRRVAMRKRVGQHPGHMADTR